MTTKKGEATKKKIVRAALGLIHQKGYKNTSMDDILMASDVTKGSLYFHFKNKDEVARAVIGRFYSYMERVNFESLTREDESRLDMLDSMFEVITSTMEKSECNGGCLLGNLALELSDYNETLRNELSNKFDLMIGRLEEIIRQGQKRSEIRSDRGPGELSHFLISIIEGGLLLAKVKKDITPLKDARRLAIDFLSP